ncbi:MAG: hypothetical protein ABIP48_26990 [Planctomycetota bacterium]
MHHLSRGTLSENVFYRAGDYRLPCAQSSRSARRRGSSERRSDWVCNRRYVLAAGHPNHRATHFKTPDPFILPPYSPSAIVAAEPDAVTMHKGIAASAWQAHAGRVPMILQSTIARPDDSACEQIATPEDAVCLGADGFAVAAFVRGPTEAAHLRRVADCVRQAARFELDVTHILVPEGQLIIAQQFTAGMTCAQSTPGIDA